jgi:purine-binding chemotaxis protein CheW
MVSETREQTAGGESTDERQLVALGLAGETYGADIAHVHSVLPMPPVTPVPQTPAYIAGVMNLRGKILPVIDLRTRFGLPPADEEVRRQARVVVVEADGIQAGLIVDGVSTVLRLNSAWIDPPSTLVATDEAACITGIGRIPSGKRAGEAVDEHLILLLDIHKVIASTSDSAANRPMEMMAA